MVSQPHTILLGGCIPHVDDALPCCFAPHSLMPALLPRSDEFRINSWRNFLEFHAGDVLVGAHLPYRPGPESLPPEGAIIQSQGNIGFLCTHGRALLALT